MNGLGDSAVVLGSPPRLRTDVGRPIASQPYAATYGAVRALPGLLERLAPPDPRRRPRVLLLHSGHLAERPGGAAVAASAAVDHHTVLHRGVPTPDSVAELANRLAEDEVDLVVAVGGGSLLDAGKAAAVLAAEPGDADASRVVAACAETHDHAVKVRVVAVPSTPGTGAEVTPFSTIWDQGEGRKLSLAGRAVRPAAAILDPSLVVGLPLPVLAGGALDSVAQGTEAAWSRLGNERSTLLGLRAVREAAGCLDQLSTRRDDRDVLLRLQRAGHLSGQAIAETPTTSVHAVSYVLTLRHGLAHGHACGTVLGRVADFNAGVTDDDCTDVRGAARVRHVLHQVAAALGCAAGGIAGRLDRFLDEVELERLDALAIDPAVVAAEAETYPRCHDNPRRFDGRLADVLDGLAGRP